MPKNRHGSNLGNTHGCHVASQSVYTKVLASDTLGRKCYLGPTTQLLYTCFIIRYLLVYLYGTSGAKVTPEALEPCLFLHFARVLGGSSISAKASPSVPSVSSRSSCQTSCHF